MCIYRNVLLNDDKTFLLNSKIFVEIPMIKQTFEVHIDFKIKTNLKDYIKEKNEIEIKIKKKLKDYNNEILDDDSNEDKNV